MRDKHWPATALGPVEGWPPALRTMTGVLLANRLPMVLWWGPDSICLYNDAAIPVLGGQHPAALGEPGRAGWTEDLRIDLRRNGFLEETHWAVASSPVPDGGVLATLHEITAQVVGRRRDSLLRDLCSARTAEEAWATAAGVFARYPADVTYAHLHLDGASDEWPIAEVIRTGTAVVVERGPEDRALVLPLRAPHVAGALVAGLSPRLALDAAYRGFLELAAERVAVALSRAREQTELDRARTAFLGNVSDELGTPLTLVLGSIEEALADRREPLTATHRGRQETAHRNALRLLKLVNSLLEVSRIEAGRTQATYEKTDLAALTAELASAFRSLVERSGLRLAIECAPIAEPVFVDREMWEQIVLNLVSNAYKFTFDGEIAVGLDASPGEVRLRVRDTGVGIDADQLRRIFERFYRVEGAQGRSYEGPGLGLALVRDLVRLHGGTVSAASERGRGTTLTVAIPTGTAHLPADRIQPVRTAPANARAAALFVEQAAGWGSDADPDTVVEAPAADPGGTRLLVVEDNPEMRDYIARLLRPIGTVDVVADGREALAAIDDQMPDLVLSDALMPNLDGPGLVRALRGDPRTRALPIVMVAARAGEDPRVASAELGVDDYIVKPFSARELVARVRSQLQLATQRREHAAALAQSDERFRALVTATSDVVYRMSADWSEMRHLVGRDFIKDTTDPSRAWLDKYIHPDDQAHVLWSINEAISTKTMFELEHRVVRVDGTPGWTFSRAIPLVDAAGELVEWFGAASDITTRKHAEAALRASEERYRTLFASIDEGFCVFDMIYDDAGRPIDYRFVEVNPAFEEHTGLVHARGRTIRELVPDQEQSWFDIYAEVARTGEPRRFEMRGESMHRWFDVYAFRLGPPETRRLAALFTDITERRITEESLRLSEKRFSTFFSRSAVAMTLVRFDDGCYAEVNDKWCELFGYSRHEVVGRPAIELAAQRAELYARFAGDGVVRDRELVLAKRSGEPCVGLLSAQVVDVGGDKVILTSFLDLTDRKRAEDALLEADRRKDEFIAVLSHELRNPLAPITNGLYLLDHAPPNSERAVRAKQIIARQVAHLSNLVNDLLDVTRIVSGKVQLHKERVDLTDIVRRAIEDSRSQFETARVALELEAPAAPVFVQADRTRMAQIVGNLLHNSAKFTQEGGRTRTSIAVEEGQAVVRVVDDGVGMAPETLARVFEPFSQAEQAIDRSKGGLGLGLALVKGLIEMHGGTATARSAGLGKGAELAIRLPLGAEARVEAPAPAPATAGPRRRVLIIEDNADAADTLSEILALRDNEVEVAYDGVAGVAKARELQPDVVLCDIGLPGMDGYDVARAVRADAALAGTVLVALSGYARPEDLERAADAGFDRHLAKPVSVDKLVAILAEVS